MPNEDTTKVPQKVTVDVEKNTTQDLEHVDEEKLEMEEPK